MNATFKYGTGPIINIMQWFANDSHIFNEFLWDPSPALLAAASMYHTRNKEDIRPLPTFQNLDY